MTSSLRSLYSDNGVNGDNVRLYVGRDTYFDLRANPVYCVYGWPHLLHPMNPTKCWRCQAELPERERAN